uniref:AlNc14C167G7913 protein n=1 Tax=Albugo laibachii Nc14 TaxID=890382 RepID=F0WN81_9STRA|nr:AlNc14C167G7913 [Albugo laibachii Nc14]|eukprot:CCA22770.1 AlNc14C167G7913 [Albugo laibachii Nc14]
MSHVEQSNRKQRAFGGSDQAIWQYGNPDMEDSLITVKATVFLSKDDVLSILYLVLSLDYAQLIDKYTQSASNTTALKLK